MFATNMREDINSIRNTVEDLKCSLNFSQKDIDDIKFKLYKGEEKLVSAEQAIFNTKCGIDEWRIVHEEITLRFLVFEKINDTYQVDVDLRFYETSSQEDERL